MPGFGSFYDFYVSWHIDRVLHGMAPEYLNQLVPVSDLSSRRRLWSSSTLQLLVPPPGHTV